MIYNPHEIEPKWQEYWEKEGLYRADNSSKKEKKYILLEFPYPSGDGLHVGHARSYSALDAISRKKRMEGYNVLFPIGWDAFGLPTENFAIKHGIHPSLATEKNVSNFKRQFKSLGISFDWEREINTTDPKYYKWTQWIFLKLFEKGLAYQEEMPINWCPSCKIGLANEEAVGGVCERCGAQVEKKNLKQWMIRITKYADRLIEDLDDVDYPERVKSQQKNWIGKSHGTEIDFKVEGTDDVITVFTTRADTLFGVTAVVLAPENPLAGKLTTKDNREKAEEYIQKSKIKSDFERENAEKEKTGVFTGSYCLNPVNGERIPIWIGDYVIASYGGGAVMMVPAHDYRDFDFAKKYGLEIKEVVIPDLGNLGEDKEVERMFKVAKEVGDGLEKADLKAWIVGTMAVILYYKKVFSKPSDIDFGVREEDFEKAKTIIQSLGYQKTKEKDYGSFKAAAYEKEGFILEIGTFDKDLGDNIIKFNNIEYRVSSPDILAELYRAKLRKGIREGKNDLGRAIFLELISGTEKEAFVDYGILTNSGKFDGLESEEAIRKITKELEKKKLGRSVIRYKLRDWIFSRQHYWGEPIPIVHCQKCGAVPISESDLPLELPYVEKYQPTGTGESPLSAISEWVNTTCPKCGGPAKRETDTMPNWAGSNWYFMRYTDPKNDKAIGDKKILKYWLPVDWYNGGMEHTTLHLLYSRFIYKFLYDVGAAPTKEPYKKRTSHGIVLAEDGRKMSKSFGNVISPDDIVKKYGADALRVYEMFMGPFDQAISWSDQGVKGVYRFLEKFWALYSEQRPKESSKEINSALHKLNKKINEDIEKIKLNTIIAAFMEFINLCREKNDQVGRDALEELVVMISPFAPHMAEELWRQLGHDKSIFLESWPKYNESLIKNDLVNIIVQVNGKMRDKIEMPAGASEDEVREVAFSSKRLYSYIDKKTPKKVIYVQDKIINIVI
jgi:leucyl-tRNA synthetase